MIAFLKKRIAYVLTRPSDGATPLYARGNWLVDYVKTKLNISRNRTKAIRRLEIGPGETRILGFETVNVFPGSAVDYVLDATKPMPFKTGSFDLIYSSHMLEHAPWYLTKKVLTEWIRILKPGGALEVWVPDGLKIAKAFVEAEESNSLDWQNDGWYKFNEERDPCMWANGRIFTYGDGFGKLDHPNWHRAVFSARYLRDLFVSLGLRDVRMLGNNEVRGYDHGWINMGIAGRKSYSKEV